LRIFGADLYLTDPALGIKGCMEAAEKLVQKIPNSFMPNQVQKQEEFK
jgi:cysteine synthase